MPPGRKRKNPLPVETLVKETLPKQATGPQAKRKAAAKVVEPAPPAKGQKIDSKEVGSSKWDRLVADKPDYAFKDAFWKSERERAKLMQSGTAAQKQVHSSSDNQTILQESIR